MSKVEIDDLGVEKPEVGTTIYTPTRCSISHGSTDIRGGKATISNVKKSMSGGKMVWFVNVEEVDNGFNWSQFLMKDQENLKEKFGDEIARPDPDIDTPWLESGDYYCDSQGNSGIYKGKPVW